VKTLEQLRTEAREAGLYAVQENPNKWACLEKRDLCVLIRGERSERLALAAGLVRTRFWKNRQLAK